MTLSIVFIGICQYGMLMLTSSKQVLVISFLKPAQARVVQGYFDGKLNIQISKLYDFNVSGYVDVMNSLIRWGCAVPQGDTTLEKFSVCSLRGS